MQLSDPNDLEALQSLIKDEKDALLKSEKAIDARVLDLHKLQVRDHVFGTGELTRGEKRRMGELPSEVKMLVKKRKKIEKRLEKLQAQMPPETSDPRPPVGLVGA